MDEIYQALLGEYIEKEYDRLENSGVSRTTVRFCGRKNGKKTYISFKVKNKR